jgi:hypothetical protein
MLIWRQSSAWAWLAVQRHIPEFVGDAGAHVSIAASQKFLGIIVVNGQPVALDVFLIDFAAEPLHIFTNFFIEDQ